MAVLTHSAPDAPGRLRNQLTCRLRPFHYLGPLIDHQLSGAAQCGVLGQPLAVGKQIQCPPKGENGELHVMHTLALAMIVHLPQQQPPRHLAPLLTTHVTHAQMQNAYPYPPTLMQN